MVTKNHLSVVAASLMRFRTRSLPTSTAVVYPNVGMPAGSGRSLSMVLGTWATLSLPPPVRATAAAADAVSSPPIVTRYETPRRCNESETDRRVSADFAGFAREVRSTEPPSKWIRESVVSVSSSIRRRSPFMSQA